MSKSHNSKTTNKNQKMEEIMKKAEVKVEVKEETEPVEEVKQRRVRHSFKEVILMRIDSKAEGLNAEDYNPIREKISSALDELQTVIEDNKEFLRTERSIKFKLSKFSKEQIESYLKTLPSED